MFTKKTKKKEKKKKTKHEKQKKHKITTKNVLFTNSLFLSVDDV